MKFIFIVNDNFYILKVFIIFFKNLILHIKFLDTLAERKQLISGARIQSELQKRNSAKQSYKFRKLID